MPVLTDQEITSFLGTVAADPEVVTFARQEFGRGLAYYRARVERLGLSGSRVLDAGCGVGNWSLALRPSFGEVHALEKRRDRLAILDGLRRRGGLDGLHPSLGSVEALPFRNRTLDAVFCNGVIPLTRYLQALEEFKRVLKPNGRLYLSFNSTDWWKHLILYRRTPDTIRFGCEAYVNRAFGLLERTPAPWPLLGRSLRLELAYWWLKRERTLETAGVTPPLKAYLYRDGYLYRTAQYLLRREAWEQGSQRVVIARDLLAKSQAGGLVAWVKRAATLAAAVLGCFWFRAHLDLMRLLQEANAAASAQAAAVNDPAARQPAVEPAHESERWVHPDVAAWLQDLAQCCYYVQMFGTGAQRLRLWRAVTATAVDGAPDYAVTSEIHAHQPAEMVAMLNRAGFREIGTSWEGTLVVDPSAPPVAPIYDCNQGVYEVLAVKEPESCNELAWSSLDVFPRNARRAALAYSTLRGGDATLSNRKVGPSADVAVSQVLRRVLPELPWEAVAAKIVQDVRAKARTKEEEFFLLYRFVQDSLFHHPCVQLLKEDGSLEDDPRLILFSGIARCGHIALVASALFQALGYPARATPLYKHVCAEVLDGERWVLIDADLWRAGVFPKDERGRWLTLAELKENPARLDALPGVGLMLSREAAWMKNGLDMTCEGYVDAGLAWERPYPSYLYFGGPLRRPPAPPRLVVQPSGDALDIRALSSSESTRTLRLLVDPVSRGWTYLDYPDQRYLNQPQGRLHSQEYTPGQLAQGIRLTFPERPLYVNVCALDEYMIAHPQVFVWPGEEVKVE